LILISVYVQLKLLYLLAYNNVIGKSKMKIFAIFFYFELNLLRGSRLCII